MAAEELGRVRRLGVRILKEGRRGLAGLMVRAGRCVVVALLLLLLLLVLVLLVLMVVVVVVVMLLLLLLMVWGETCC